MKKVFNLSLLMAALVMIGLASCKSNEPKKVAVTGVTVNPTKLELKVGATSKITATVAPNDATNKKVTWASSNTKVATVDASGNVKAVAVGTADITVTTEDGKKTATCAVTVTEQGSTASKKVDFHFFTYKGNLGVEGKHFYQINLLEEGVLKDGKIVKDGQSYVFLISANEPTSDTDFTPKSGGYGVYEFGAPNQFDVMTLVNHKNFTYTGKIVNGKFDNTSLTAFSSGQLTLAANKIAFKGKDENNAEYDIVFEGNYKVEDGRPKPYDLEPTEKTTINATFNQATFKALQDLEKSKPITMITEVNSDKMYAGIVFFVAKGTNNLPNGTYNVSETGEPNTVLKSVGTIDGSVYYSFYAKVDDEGYIIAPVYFFDNGTAVVTDNKIEFNVTSHFGSTLKLTYTGSIQMSQGVAPAYLKSTRGLKVKETANSADLIKAIR